MPEDRIIKKTPHNVIIENRSKFMITGVNDVDSFDDESIVLMTDEGELTIRGYGLHIEKFDVDSGEIAATGEVIALVYTNDRAKQSSGFFGRLFK